MLFIDTCSSESLLVCEVECVGVYFTLAAITLSAMVAAIVYRDGSDKTFLTAETDFSYYTDLKGQVS
jgi:hypothetical protein